MTVEKLKQVVSLEGIAELNPDAQYIVHVKKNIPREVMENMRKTLDSVGLKCVVVVGDIEFYEIKR